MDSVHGAVDCVGPVGMANTKFPTQEGSNQNLRLLNGKRPYPPEAKANQNERQTQQKRSSPLEEENTKFHQLSLDKPQDKHRPLKQQSKSMLLWPRHYCHKSESNHQ
jgi:hypothetical protein